MSAIQRLRDQFPGADACSNLGVLADTFRPPTVSVLMPVYNAAPFLREAIDSILTQTFADFELIIVDDGSTDESRSIARSYLDPRVRVLAEPHRGLVSTRNAALQAARGEYIACMDADDVSIPERLAKQIAFMQAHPDTVVVGTGARLIDRDGRLLGKSIVPLARGRKLYVLLCVANRFVNGSTIMRREAVLAVQGYRDGYAPAEDYDLWFRLGELGELANLAEPLYLLRIHPSSTTTLTGAKGVDDRARAARHSAIQRRLAECGPESHARLNAVASLESPNCREQVGIRKVALTDWAQVLFWQGQLRLAVRVLAHVVLYYPHQPRDAFSPHIVVPNSLSTAYLREVLQAVQQGTWIGLGRAKVRRIIDRPTESLSL